jgi:hypothetical protein
MTNALRRLGFAWVHAAVVAVYTTWLCDALPPLRSESPWLVVVPATGIVAIVAKLTSRWLVARPVAGWV